MDALAEIPGHQMQSQADAALTNITDLITPKGIQEAQDWEDLQLIKAARAHIEHKIDPKTGQLKAYFQKGGIGSKAVEAEVLQRALDEGVDLEEAMVTHLRGTIGTTDAPRALTMAFRGSAIDATQTAAHDARSLRQSVVDFFLKGRKALYSSAEPEYGETARQVVREMIEVEDSLVQGSVGYTARAVLRESGTEILMGGRRPGVMSKKTLSGIFHGLEEAKKLIT